MTLAFDRTGSGPPVVLLHAGVCDRRMWDPQVGSLAAAHTVIRPDLPGYGETPYPTGDSDPAAEVVALLDRLAVDQTALIGASFGGRVAVEIAARWPDRVSTLITLGAPVRGLPGTPSLDAFDEEEEALFEAGDVDGATDLNVRTWLGPEATAETRRRVREMQRNIFELQMAGEERYPDAGPVHVEIDIPAVTARTLVVVGDHDLDYFHASAADLAASIPGAQLLRLPWAGHLPSMERPTEIADLVLDFLAGR